MTFIRAAGIGNRDGENDAMTLWVYPDHLRLDRYVIPPGEPRKPIEGPFTVWTGAGRFFPYRRPEPPKQPANTGTRPAADTPPSRD